MPNALEADFWLRRAQAMELAGNDHVRSTFNLSITLLSRTQHARPLALAAWRLTPPAFRHNAAKGSRNVTTAASGNTHAESHCST